jgi:hypothetical protein
LPALFVRGFSIGHERILAAHHGLENPERAAPMSAFGVKADVAFCDAHVRL